MSKMKIDAHEIEFDDDLMNLFKTNNDGFQKTIETISKVLIDSDREERISSHKIDCDKEVSLHKVDCDKEIKKYSKCHSTFNNLVDCGMEFLSDFTKGYRSSSEYLDNRTDDEVEKDINENYKFVN